MYNIFRTGTLILGLLGAMLLAGDAHAQNVVGRVESELRRTDDVMVQAGEIVRQALGPRPAQILSDALSRQQEAWGHFRQGAADPDRPIAVQINAARTKTLAARQGALRAVELARSQIRLLERVQQLLAQNRELVRRARELIGAVEDDSAGRLLEAGIKELDRGQRAFNAQEFRSAVRFVLLGRDLLLRAMRTADGGAMVPADRIRVEIERTDEFLSEARTAMDDTESVRARYEEAERLQSQAREQLRAGRHEHARRFTQRARQVALELLRRDSSVPSREEVEGLVDRVTVRFEEIRLEARDVEDRQIDRLLGQAEAHLAKAREGLAEDDLRLALAETQLASSLLGQARNRLH